MSRSICRKSSFVGHAMVVLLSVFCVCQGQAAPMVATVSAEFPSAGMSTVFHRPLVNNRGQVGFLAARRGTPANLGWLNSYLHDGESSLPVFPEVPAEPMPWEKIYVGALVGDGTLESFGGILFQTGSADGISLAWTGTPGAAEYPSVVLNGSSEHGQLKLADLTVSYASQARRLMMNGGGFRCVAAALSEDGSSLELQAGLGDRLDPSEFSTAMSADGRYVFYSSERAPASTVPGFVSSQLLSIYRYDMHEDVVVFIGQCGRKSMDPELSCSADGRVVSYVCRLHDVTHAYDSAQIVMHLLDVQGKVSSPLVISRWHGEVAEAAQGGVSWLKHDPCGYPQVSADGQFVVFSARTMNFPGGGAGSSEQVYRYGVATETLEQVSVGQDAPCVVPGVSPDGRMVAFVQRQGEEQSVIMLADCGPSLIVPEVSAGGVGGFELEIESSAHGQFRLVADGSSLPAGAFVAANGQSLVLGEWYDVSLLPVSYVAAQAERVRVTVEVRDRENGPVLRGSTDIEVTLPWSLEVLSVDAQGSWPSVLPTTSYEGLGLSEDGRTVLFSTGADLLGDLGVHDRPVQRLFVRRQRNGAWRTERLTGVDKVYGKPVGQSALSGNGKAAVFVHDGELIRLDLAEGRGATLSRVGQVVQVRADYSAQTVVWLEHGEIRRWANQDVTSLGVSDAEEFLLSRDGRTVVFVSGASLWGWTAGMAFPIRLSAELPSVRLSGLSLSGHRVYYMSGAVLYAQDFGSEPKKLGVFESGMAVRVSGNGGVALFTRKTDGMVQLHVRKLNASEFTEVLVSSPNGVIAGHGQSDSLMAPACLSGDGRTVVFASLAGNLCEGDTNGAQDLFRWTDLDFRHESPVWQLVGKGHEDQTLEMAVTPVSDPGSNLVLRVPENPSESGAAVTLQEPSVTLGAYVLHVTPRQDFCGEDAVRLVAYDGTETVELTVSLMVENVNDAPEWLKDTYELTVTENELKTWKMSDQVRDVDLHNPEPYADALDFEPGTLEGVELSVIDGRLTVKAGHEMVTRETDGAVFEIPLTVQDRAGAQAVSILRLSIRNANRAPVAGVRELVLREDEELSLATKPFADPDEGDELSYVFEVKEGTLRDCRGTAIVGAELVSSGRFPVAYQASEGSFNKAFFRVRALDASGAESPWVTVQVELLRQRRSVRDLWGGSVDENGMVAWTGLQKGWNLLSVPMELKNEDFAAFTGWLQGGAIWRWDGARRRYERGQELKAQEGFWVFLKQLPTELDVALQGGLGRPQQAISGWQLVAPGATAEKAFYFDQEAGVLVREGQGRPGQGVWRYAREQ